MANYYPFGMMQPGRQWAADSSLFGYNGKEKMDEIAGRGNDYDYGERMYDTRSGRFWSLDPLSPKYPNISPFVYAGNSPIMFVDPDGKVIRIFYFDNGKFKFYNYKPGVKPSVDNEFVQQVHEGVTQIMANDPNQTFQKMSQSKEPVSIVEIYSFNDRTQFKTNEELSKIENVAILWNPLSGLETTKGGLQAPSTGLEHEGEHALRLINTDTREKLYQLNLDATPNGTFYDNLEEQRVIDDFETPYLIGKNLMEMRENHLNPPKLEGMRTNHRGYGYKTKGVNTTDPEIGVPYPNLMYPPTNSLTPVDNTNVNKNYPPIENKKNEK